MIKNYFSKKKSKWKAILLTLTILGTLFGIIMYVVISAGFTSYAILTQNKNNKIRTKTTRTYYTVNKYADEEPEIEGTTSATNGSGLNLMLINNIKTEGFVKEYLTLAARSQNGELSDYKEHLDVGGIIATAMAEQGAYSQSGGILPLTCLPWDNSTNSPKWNKSQDITLEKATYPTFMKIGYEYNAWHPNNYYGPFQQTAAYFTDGTYRPSKLLGTGMSAGRTTGDWTYFPDQLAGLDQAVESSSSFGDDLTPSQKGVIASMYHNVGNSWVRQFLSTYNGTNSEAFKAIYNDLNTQYEKYKGKIGSIMLSGSEMKWVANFLFMEAGWNITTRAEDDGGSGNNSYRTMSVVNKSVCLKIFRTLGLGNTDAEMQEYLKSKLKNPSDYGNCMKATTQGTIWKDCGEKGRLFMLTETGGHLFNIGFMGDVYYARMLKYAGVDVDPANPETYMNKYQGEWMPSGDLLWLKEAVPSIDINSVPKRVGEFLNFAKQFLGTPYVWGGRQPGGFDCSGYIQYCVQTHFGGTFGATTEDQPYNPRSKSIPYDQRRIGDFMYFHWGAGGGNNAHVVIYLADAEDGFIWAMHAPQTGDVVKIGKYRITGKQIQVVRLTDYGS